jgi:hypothetical protein
MENIEIPLDLDRRLSEEKLKKVEENLSNKHRESFVEIDYFLESDLKTFSKFSESEDLISEKESLKHLYVLAGCTHLGLIYQLAAHFKRLPCEIECWTASRGPNDERLRIYDCIPASSYPKPLNHHETYFIRFVEENDGNVLEESCALIQLQEEWLKALRKNYLQNLPSGLNLTFDPCEGCSIGQGGHIVKNLTTASQHDPLPSREDEQQEEGMAVNYLEILTRGDATRRQLVACYHHLCHRASTLMSQSEGSILEGSILIIFRAYETEAYWRSLGIRGHSNPSGKQRKTVKDTDSVTSSSSSVICDAGDDDEEGGDDEDLIDDGSIGHRTRRIIYLGCMKMLPTQLYKHLELQFQHLLVSFFQEQQVPFPDKWKFVQFVNVDSNSDVVTYRRTPSDTLLELEIEAGDILYCVPISDLEEEEEVASATDLNDVDEDLVDKLFASNTYVDDLKQFFENETTKVPVTIKFHRYFEDVDALYRLTGLWRFSDTISPSEDEVPTTFPLLLSKKKCCSEIIRQLEDHFRLAGEDRLLVGKSITLQAGSVIFRQLRHQNPQMTFNEFIAINAKILKYYLHLVLLPFSIKDRFLHNMRYFEFILCDKKMVRLRREWLERVIYSQARERYREQIQQLVSERAEEGLFPENISRWDISPISFSLLWPENIDPVPDEWIHEQKIYLKIQTTEDDSPPLFSLSDLIQQIKENVTGGLSATVNSSPASISSPQRSALSHETKTQNDLQTKRRLEQVASDSDLSDNEGPTSDQDASRKRSKHDFVPTKQFISRGDFSLPLQLPFSQSEAVATVASVEEEEEGDFNNPFLFEDSPWGRHVYLTETVELSGSVANDWGGPYHIIFEIDDAKVGRILSPRTAISDLPCSW